MKRTPSSSLHSSSYVALPSSSPTVLPFSSIPTCSGIYSALLQHKILLFLLLLLQHVIPGAEAVTVHSVRVPQPAIVGKPAKLECFWESGDKDFYSVRWYMNNEQFYSFILGNVPEKVDHRLPGINVAVSYSDQRVVTLSEVTMASEGKYRCEVMSEAPFFQTSFASANLTVVDLPEDPEIRGIRQLYRVGESVNATCTARDARPPALIVFEINGIVVTSDMGHVRELGVVEGSHRGVYTSTSQLLYPLAHQHVPTLIVKCHAFISSIQVETSLVTQVDPARTTMLSFFNKGSPSASTSSIVLLTALMTMYVQAGFITTFI